jgi:molecular chaperone DnaJ
LSTKDYIEKDYYQALGVAKDADARAVKKAFNKIAKENHPDHNPGDPKAEARFKEASEAYSVLSDADKRKEYDQTRATFASGGFRAPGGFSPGGSGDFAFDLSNLFGGGGSNVSDALNDLFSGGWGRHSGGPNGYRGEDQHASLNLSFEAAVRGTTMPVQLSGPGRCTLCGGTGAKPGTSVHTCSSCSGTGSITNNMGGFGFSEPCRGCSGTGRIPDDPCPQCGGTGVANQTRTFQVRVPAGVKDGARLRLAGKGNPGSNGGPNGDLFVTLRVAEHRLFGRKGNDLTLTVPVTFTEAALGTTLRVPTLDGAVSLKVVPGTPSGRTLRVRGRGVPAKARAGDLLVTIEVSVPRKLSTPARQALEAFAAAQPDDPRPHLTAALEQVDSHV